MSEITTTARRITRALNRETKAGWRLHFDGEGNVLTRIYGPEAFGPKRDTYTHCFTTFQEPNVVGAPLHRFTEREVQDAIDQKAEDEALLDDPALQAEVDAMSADADR